MLSLIAAAVLCLADAPGPSAEVSAFFQSSKVERGMIENQDPVFGWEAEVEWFGFKGAFEACHDMTGANERAGRYNELATRCGYEYAPLTFLELDAAYVYKHAFEGHTQELEAEARFPLAWCVPYFSANVDADACAGAFYGVCGVFREMSVLDALTITPEIGFGFGNAKRNFSDFECCRDAARDIHARLSARWEVCSGLSVCPSVAVYDQFTDDGRHAFRKGFFAVAGLAVHLEF